MLKFFVSLVLKYKLKKQVVLTTIYITGNQIKITNVQGDGKVEVIKIDNELMNQKSDYLIWSVIKSRTVNCFLLRVLTNIV